MNINMLDAGTAGAIEYIAFFNGTALSPFIGLKVVSGGDSTFDLTAFAQGNEQTATDVIAEDSARFLYGKLEASADLLTWTVSANITDDVSGISATENWSLSQSFIYGQARDSHANRLSFDAAGSQGRMRVDEIRLGETYADVTAIPEPATLGMIAACGAGLLFIRHRFLV